MTWRRVTPQLKRGLRPQGSFPIVRILTAAVSAWCRARQCLQPSETGELDDLSPAAEAALFRVSASKRTAFKRRALDEGTTVQALLEAFVNEYTADR